MPHLASLWLPRGVAEEKKEGYDDDEGGDEGRRDGAKEEEEEEEGGGGGEAGHGGGWALGGPRGGAREEEAGGDDDDVEQADEREEGGDGSDERDGRAAAAAGEDDVETGGRCGDGEGDPPTTTPRAGDPRRPPTAPPRFADPTGGGSTPADAGRPDPDLPAASAPKSPSSSSAAAAVVGGVVGAVGSEPHRGTLETTMQGERESDEDDRDAEGDRFRERARALRAALAAEMAEAAKSFVAPPPPSAADRGGGKDDGKDDGSNGVGGRKTAKKKDNPYAAYAATLARIPDPFGVAAALRRQWMEGKDAAVRGRSDREAPRCRRAENDWSSLFADSRSVGCSSRAADGVASSQKEEKEGGRSKGSTEKRGGGGQGGNAKQYWIDRRKDVRVLIAMHVGSGGNDDASGLPERPHAARKRTTPARSRRSPPWWYARTSLRPRRPELRSEIRRRCFNEDHDTVPLQLLAKWTYVECARWLCDHPVSNPDDAAFVKAEVRKVKAAGLEGEVKRRVKRKEELDYLRLFHVIATDERGMRDGFRTRNRRLSSRRGRELASEKSAGAGAGANASAGRIEAKEDAVKTAAPEEYEEEKPFWDNAAELYNDETYVPTTCIHGALHCKYHSSAELRFEDRELGDDMTVHGRELYEMFAKCRWELRELMARWKRRGGIVDLTDESDAKVKSIERTRRTQIYVAEQNRPILYLWYLCEENGIMDALGDDDYDAANRGSTEKRGGGGQGGKAKQYWIDRRKDVRVLIAMHVGSGGNDDTTGLPAFRRMTSSLSPPPWWYARTSHRPRRPELRSEIRRRCFDEDHDTVPLQLLLKWTYVECVRWLCDHPVSNPDDAAFVKAEMRKVKVAEIEGELKRRMKRKKELDYLRLFHVIATDGRGMKEGFRMRSGGLSRRRGRELASEKTACAGAGARAKRIEAKEDGDQTAAEEYKEEEPFWDRAADLYNDETYVPTTCIHGALHCNYDSSAVLRFEDMELGEDTTVHGRELYEMFAKCRWELRELMARWKKRRGIVDLTDESDATVKSIELTRRSQIYGAEQNRPILYLWYLCEENGIMDALGDDEAARQKTGPTRNDETRTNAGKGAGRDLLCDEVVDEGSVPPSEEGGGGAAAAEEGCPPPRNGSDDDRHSRRRSRPPSPPHVPEEATEESRYWDAVLFRSALAHKVAATEALLDSTADARRRDEIEGRVAFLSDELDAATERAARLKKEMDGGRGGEFWVGSEAAGSGGSAAAASGPKKKKRKTTAGRSPSNEAAKRVTPVKQKRRSR